MRREKDMSTSILIDLYGALLTDKQRCMLDMYFNLDYSLSEIAENTGISRQGVLNNIRHGEARLKELDAALGIKCRFERTESGLEEIEDQLSGMGEGETRTRILKIISGIRAVWED